MILNMLLWSGISIYPKITCPFQCACGGDGGGEGDDNGRGGSVCDEGNFSQTKTISILFNHRQSVAYAVSFLFSSSWKI